MPNNFYDAIEFMLGTLRIAQPTANTFLIKSGYKLNFMKAPKNRRVFVIGYGAATPLGLDFARTWQRAVNGEAGFCKVTRCAVQTSADVVVIRAGTLSLLISPPKRKSTTGTPHS